MPCEKLREQDLLSLVNRETNLTVILELEKKGRM